jgi:hypothetical protein
LVAASNGGRFPSSGVLATSFSFITIAALNWINQLDRSVKLLLVFTSAVIPAFSLLEIHDRDSTSSKSELIYDWRFVAIQFILAPSLLRITTRIFSFN